MSTIEEQLAILNAPSPPAIEVVTMRRVLAEQALIALEQIGTSASNILELRGLLAETAEQLWAIHSVGPGEEYPCLNKEDAERRAREIRALGDEMKADRIARGESVEHWCDWVINVIPSPWEPAEHFAIMAQEWMDDSDQLRSALISVTAERDQLQAEVAALSKNVIEMTRQDFDQTLNNLRRMGASIDGDNGYKRDLCDNIAGAIAFGYQGNNQPPSGHWANRFWDMGRAEGAMREELTAALKLNRENLRACQATIHLAGGFDPAYVNDAQAAMKVADQVLTKYPTFTSA